MASEAEIRQALAKFSDGARVLVQNKGEGLYRVGWLFRDTRYIPPPKGHLFEEAVETALEEFWASFPEHSYEDLI